MFLNSKFQTEIQSNLMFIACKTLTKIIRTQNWNLEFKKIEISFRPFIFVK